MLSVENPPPDLSCSSQFLQLNDRNSDEKASHNLLLPEVDLLKQPHDHLPKFSIRSYVFTSRSKDINKNWPFSLKNLQLCLKHGVKDVLPPFQALSAVKSRSIKRCTVETCSLETESISNFDAEPSGPNEKEVLDSSGNSQLNNKLENACIDRSSYRSGGENDLPCTITSVSRSDIETIPTKSPSSSSLETNSLLEAEASASASATVEVGAAAHPTSHKSENTSRPPGKKCRLIVKFSGNSDRSSTEEIASNSTAVSETMASKVCPVCKTFTSSSNTTLNAHIDQCLSEESTPKWTADSKPTRHRIKPRKTRLIVDIYSTAQMCTLEELDRRNDTNWATVSNLPTQDTEKLEIAAEWKRKRVCQVHPEDTGNVDEVYIDANGTKLRILSKSNDAPAVSIEVEDFQPKNPLEGGHGSKFLSTKRKKRHARKHLKYLKLAPQSRKPFSRKARARQMFGDHEEGYGVEESGKEKLQIQKQIKSCDSGTSRQWVCSKRTGLTKKDNNQDSGQAFRYKWHLARDLLVDSGRSSLGKSLTERNRLSSPAISNKAEKPFYDGQVSDKCELSSGRKRVGSLLYGAKDSDSIEKSRLPLKQNGNQLSRDTPIIRGSQTFESFNHNINRISSLSNKRVGVHGGAGNDSDIPPRASTPSMCTQAFASTSLKPILRKNRSSVLKSKHNRDEKCSAGTKTRPDLVGNVDDEVAAWDSEVDQQYALICKDGRKEINDKTSFGRSTGRGMIQDREAVSTSKGKEAMALESSEQSPRCYGKDDGENTDSSARAGDDLIDKVDVLESVEDAVATMSESVDTKFQQLSGRSNSQLNSLHSVEDYNGMLCGSEAVTGPTVPSFVDGQEMYDSDEAGNGIIGKNAHMEPGVDSDIGQGHPFPEVDRIPIPGPPGSFLPSPRDMGSDDFQGNSSLTTSRVQSSQEQVDLVNGDSSDSPISVSSIISNSTAKGPDLKYSEPFLSVGAQAVQDKTKSGFSTAGLEPLVENAAVVAQTAMGAEKCYFDGEKSKVNKMIEKRPLNFKNDSQPCCCQRKERISQDIAVNYQESLLSRRRTVNSVTVPATVKQNVGSNNLDARPELFSLSSCPNFVSEKAVLPMIKSLAGSIPVKGSAEAGVKVLGHGDCDSPSPSTPNPVLRLMGKNLMVVNKEEDASVPFGQSQPCSQNGHVISQFPTSSLVSPGNMLNQDCHSFPHMVPEGPVIFSYNPYDAAGQPFDVRLSRCFGNQINLRTPQTPAQVANLFGNQHVNGGFRTSMESHIYEDAYSLSSSHDRPKIRLREASSYNMGNTVTTLDSSHNNADCGASINEIIVIDDVPESEANMSADVAKYSGSLRASQMISSGISIPTVPNINSRRVNPFPCHQSQDPPVVDDFHAIFSRLPNASPVRWGCTTEGSSMLQWSPFVAAPTSTGHVRSGSYYAPSLS